MSNRRGQAGKSAVSASRRKKAVWIRGLEVLEDRAVPSTTVTWTLGASGNWGTPANWTDNLGAHRRPESTDDVIIPSTGSPTVTVDVFAEVHSLSSQANLVIPGGLTLDAASTNNGSLSVSGSLNAAGGLAQTGSIQWTSGTVFGTVNQNGSLSISGDVNKTLYGTINTNGGSGTWSGTGSLRFQNDGESSPNLHLKAGAVFDVQGAVFSNNYGGSTTASLTIDNGGKLVVHAGAGGTATIGASLVTSGAVDVETGTASFDYGGTVLVGANFSGPGTTAFGGGTMTVNSDAGATNLAFTGGTFDVTGTHAFGANGAVSWTGGILKGTGELRLVGNSAMTISGTVTGGNLVIDCVAGPSVTWTGGSVFGTVNVNGPFNITGNENKYLYGTIGESNGAGTWNGTGSIYFQNDGTSSPSFGINATASIDIKSGIYVQVYGGSTPATISCAGSIQVHAGTEMATINAALNLMSGGNVDVESGGITFNGGGHTDGVATFTGPGTATFGGGTMVVTGSSAGPKGTHLALTGGTLDVEGVFNVTSTFLWSGGTMKGAGSLELASQAALTIKGDVTGDKLMIRSGNIGSMVTWTGGSVFGEVDINGNFSIGGSDNKYLYGTIDAEQGSGTWSGAGTTYFQNDGTYSPNLKIGGTIDITSGILTTTYGGSTPATITNTGRINVHAGTETATINAALNTSGMVDVETGDIKFNGGGLISGANPSFTGPGTATFSGGTMTVGAAVFTQNLALTGGTLTFSAGFTLTDLGTFLWSGGTLAGSTAGRLVMANKALTIAGTVTGAADSAVINSSAPHASVNWASGSVFGTVNIQGNFSIAGSDNKFLYGTINANGGSGTWTGAGTTYFQNDGTSSPKLNLGNSSVLDIQSGINVGTYGGSTPATITNDGTISVHAGTATATIAAALNGAGTVDVETGGVSFNGGGTVQAAKFTGPGTTTFGGGTMTVNSAIAQNLALAGGTLNVAGQLFDSGTFLWSGGTLTGIGELDVKNMTINGTVTGDKLAIKAGIGDTGVTWTGGSIFGTTNITGPFSIGGSDNKFLYGTVNVDKGMGTWTGTGTTYFQNDGTSSPTLNFGAQGGIDIKAGITTSVYGGTTPATINNLGQIQVHSGTATATIAAALNTSGTVNVFSGGISFNGGGTISDGAVFAGVGTTTFGGGTMTVNGAATITNGALAGGTLSVAGTFTDLGTFFWSGGTLSGAGKLVLSGNSAMTINGTVTGDKLAIESPANGVAVTWTGGSIFGTVNNTGRFSIAGSDNKFLYGTINTDGGSGTWTGTGTTYFQNDGTSSPTLNLGALAKLDIQAGISTSVYGGSTPATINNAGTLLVHSGTASATITPAFNSSGIVDVENGAISFNGGGTISAGASFVGPGTATFGGGPTTVNGAVTALNLGLAGGSMTVAGTLTDTGTFLWTGGTLGGLGALKLGPNAVMTINATNTATGQSLAVDSTAPGALVNWIGGSVFGTVTNNGNFSIGGSDNKFLYGTIKTDNGAGTWKGAGTLYMQNDGTNSPTLMFGPAAVVDIQSGIYVSTYGGSTPATISDAGPLLVHAGSDTVTIAAKFIGTGTLDVESGSIAFNGGGTLDFDGTNTLISRSSTGISFTGNLLGGTTNGAAFTPLGSILLNGTGTAAQPELFEVMSKDLGFVAAGFIKNFAYNAIRLESGAYVKLVDNGRNSGTAAEALYVNSLVVPNGATLDLNGLHVYVRSSAIVGTVINGTVTKVSTGGLLTLGQTQFGTLLSTSEIDNWTFFGRAGDSVAIVVNTGKDGMPAPVDPQVNFAQFDLDSPSGTHLSTGTNSNSGADALLPKVVLPADGTYTIHVHSQSGANAKTGNYAITVYDASVNKQAVTLNQATYGQISSPYSQDQWTFSALANEQVQFHLLSTLNPAFQFALTGPNGYTGFTGQAGSSDPLTLPSAGTYTLTVQSSAPAAYSFRLDLTSQIPLTIGTAYQGTLAGSGQAQLFQVMVPTDESLLVTLTDTTSADHNELYISKDAPPTRSNYQYRYSDNGAANQSILVPTATAGTWYVLLYGASVSAASNYTILASTSSLHVDSISPAQLGNGAAGVVALAGSGFDGTTTVQFVGKDGAIQTPADVKSVTDATLTLDLDLTKWKAQVYDVKVTKGTNTVTLPSAFTVTAASKSTLQTDLTVPASLGRHGSGTLYLTYTNTGTVAMPAPILQVHGTLGALLTLDPHLAGPGLSTNVLPPGFSDTVTVLGSGSAATPGLLQPGDSVQVPVYYRGLLQPWDLSKTQVQFTVDALSSTDTTAIDWAAIRAGSPLADLSSTGQDQFWAALKALAGVTGGALDQALAGGTVANNGGNFQDVIDSLVASAAYQVTADLGGGGGAGAQAGTPMQFPTFTIGPNSTGIVIAAGQEGSDGSAPRTHFVLKGYVDGPKLLDDGTSYSSTDPAIVDALSIAAAFPNDRVVLVDWTAAANPDGTGAATDASNSVNYQHAARNALTVGDELALWVQENNVAPESIDVFGAGLGAQTAGEFGAQVQQLQPGHALDAIFAADPAGPGFSGRDSSLRLDGSDATRVVAIHTTQTLGDTESVGTTDQFVTGASFNPVAAQGQAWTLLLQSLTDDSLRTTNGKLVGYAADTAGVQLYALPSGTQRADQHVQAGTEIGQAIVAQVATIASATTTTSTKLADSSDIVSITGPAGAGAANFVTPDASLPYQINFQNPSTASTPVQSLTITEQLDSNLDWTSFQLTSVGFGATNLPIPPDSQFYQTTIPLTANGATFNLQIEISFDSSTGILSASFQSIDPDTDLPPSLLEGFLLPEDGSGQGTGYLTYVVNPKSGLTTGTAIKAVAQISFDGNAAIATNQVNDADPTQGTDPAKTALVTIDAGAPSSTVAALPAKTNTTSFKVNWSGQDDTGGSGVAFYDVYFVDNGGEAKLFVGHTTATSGTFTGLRGHTYAFYSIATDNAGNVEAAPAAPEANTKVLLQTKTVVVAAPNPVLLGGKTTFTATVSAVGATSAPTGSVTFKEGTKVLGTGTLSTTGGVTTATFSTTKLTAGKHTITAVYGGDANDATSTSTALNVVVDRFASTTKLVVSVNPSFFGQKATFTATVAGVGLGAARPTGSVTFIDGKTTLGTGTLALVNGKMTATFSTAKLTLGKHPIKAVYSGDSNDFTSTSTALNFTVGQDRTTTKIAASTTAPVFGQNVTFTATIAIVSPGAGTPTGKVTFKDGTKVLGTGNVSTSHGITTATFSTSALGLGKHTITAVYGGDTNDAASTATAVIATVGQYSTTTKLVASASQPTSGSPVTFTATIVIVSPGAGTPTGSVTFKDGTKVLATKNVSTANGVTTATFTTSSLTAGKHTITAVYSGSSQGKSSTSKGVTITVGPVKVKAHSALRMVRTGPAGPLGLA